MTNLAKKETRALARPLKALVPLIQDELSAGNNAGLEHYRRAGEMLLEAREQVAEFKWGKWLSKNFELSARTAYNYILLAERVRKTPNIVHRRGQTLTNIVNPNARPAHAEWKDVFEAAKEVDVDAFAEARQVRHDETELHRELALELIELGFKALATRLHPDHGGSEAAMRRLNRVRRELKSVAATRRFE